MEILGKAKKHLFLILCLIILCSSVFAAEISFPAAAAYVNDYAEVIDPSHQSNLEALCKSLEKKTGVEMSIVTIKTTAPLDVNTYAVKLFEKWKIGKKGKDNGLLILTAVDDRRTKIEVGYGLEGVITDGYCGRVLDEQVIPSFKSGNYGKGLYDGSLVISEKIINEYSVTKAAPTKASAVKPVQKKKDYFLLIMFLTVIIIVALSLLMKSTIILKSIVGMIIGAVLGFIFASAVGAIFGAIIGLAYGSGKVNSGNFPGGFGTFIGGGFGGGSFGGGGGFGGFGGGGSGGGGAGRSW